jgi:hypothetical protein
MPLDAGMGALLIDSHQPAIPDDVGGQDGGEPAGGT